MRAPIGRIGYVLNTCLRSKYGYNAILLNKKERSFATDEEVIMALMKTALKSRTKAVTRRFLSRSMAIFQIEPLYLKLKRNVADFIRKLKKLMGLQCNNGSP